MKKKHRSSISDIAEPFVSVTDIEQYIYCPQLIYFDRVLHASLFLVSQEDSKELHEDYVRKELRQETQFIIRLSLFWLRSCCSLSSNVLGLQGNVDCIIKTASGEYVSVDYKNMSSYKGWVWMDHKYQLIAYALLENFDTIVKRALYIIFLKR
ncbi:MAG: PD-(D/E)XK nuclease family protein [Nitrososphaerota archaeon]